MSENIINTVNTVNPTDIIAVDIPDDNATVVDDVTPTEDTTAPAWGGGVRPKQDSREEYVSTRTLQAYLDNKFAKFVDKVDNMLAAGEPMPSASFLGNDMLFTLREEVRSRNLTADKDDKWSPPNEFSLTQYVSQLMLRYDNVARISMAEDSAVAEVDPAAMLGIYNPSTGLYECGVDKDGKPIAIVKRIKEYYRSYTTHAINEVLTDLAAFAPVRTRTINKYLSPVGNGIYDKASGTLLPYSPDYVFLTKTLVNYNPDAENVYITMPDGEVWDCEWQMRAMAATDDNGEQLRLHWQMLAAAVRPYWPFNRAVFLYSTLGNNGKGTLLHLVENLVGSNAAASLNLANMAKPFGLADVRMGKTAILGHENENDNRAIDSVTDVKALITGDSFYADIKHSAGCTVRYHGVCFQCLNGLPIVRDRSNSFLRRIILDEFTTCFEGVERKYIKSEYLNRSDVLEYYLKRALELDCDEYDIPAAAEKAIDNYRAFNDPVVEFWYEFRDAFKWNILPRDFLYGLFKNWFMVTNPSGHSVNRKTFWAQLATIVTKERNDNNIANKFVVKSATKEPVNDSDMAAEEPLILEYNVEKYMSESYKGVDYGKRLGWVRPKTINYCLKRIK